MHIAFFGLGNMGFPIAANLLKHGHTVTTAIHRNPTPAPRLQELGAAIAASPAEALKDAEIIFTIVPNDRALLGLLDDGDLIPPAADPAKPPVQSAPVSPAPKAQSSTTKIKDPAPKKKRAALAR